MSELAVQSVSQSVSFTSNTRSRRLDLVTSVRSRYSNEIRTDFENNSNKNSLPCEICLKFAVTCINFVRQECISFDSSCT